MADDGVTKAEALDGQAPWVVLGATGLRRYAGYIREEFLRELVGERGRAVIREMVDNDAVIGALLLAIDLQMRQVAWNMEPADDSPQAADIAEFVWSCFGDMDDTWPDLLSQIGSMLAFGWSLHEVCFKLRHGDDPGNGEDGLPLPTSRYDDGLIGWSAIEIRSQESLLEWWYEGNRLMGMDQYDPASGGVYRIPLTKAVHFRTTAAKANPEGRSVLRNAYPSWHKKRRVEEFESIGIERDLAGLPVGWVPWQYLTDDASDAQKQVASIMRDVVTKVRRNEVEGLVLPIDYDLETKQPNFRFELLASSGPRQFDINQVLARLDARILLSALADFLLLGQEGVSGLGTAGLGVSKVELFQSSITAWLDAIAAEFNARAIPQLVRLNGWDPALAPTLAHGPVDEMDLDQIMRFVGQMTTAGVPLFPDETLQNHLLTKAGLPTTSSGELA